MTENRMDQKTCEVCNQSFSSDRELQEHQKNSHSQGSGREKDQQKREKIA